MAKIKPKTLFVFSEGLVATAVVSIGAYIFIKDRVGSEFGWIPLLAVVVALVVVYAILYQVQVTLRQLLLQPKP